MSDTISNERLNELFAQRSSTEDGRTKIAETTAPWIRDRLREVSFCEKVLPPQKVTRADCQISENHDTLVKIVFIEPKSRAMSLTFRGSPTVNFIRGPRAACAFYTVSSEKFEKTEQELMIYDFPITKVIEDNSVKDMAEIPDREFLIHIEAACQALQTEANGGVSTALHRTTILAGTVVEFSIRKGELARVNANSTFVYPIQRPDLVNGFKMLDGNRLRAERVLATEPDMDDLLQLTSEDMGQSLQSETMVSGWKYNTLLGRNVIRTIKTDILRPGNLYFFAAPEFLGKFYVLNDTKFYIDKVGNTISFWAWRDLGMIIANIAAVRKVELYSGDANPTTDASSYVAAGNFIPVTEDALGALNNRVDSGLKYPNVVSF